MDGLKLIARTVSLGDAETLIQHPASMTILLVCLRSGRTHVITEALMRRREAG